MSPHPLTIAVSLLGRGFYFNIFQCHDNLTSKRLSFSSHNLFGERVAACGEGSSLDYLSKANYYASFLFYPMTNSMIILLSH